MFKSQRMKRNQAYLEERPHPCLDKRVKGCLKIKRRRALAYLEILANKNQPLTYSEILKRRKMLKQVILDYLDRRIQVYLEKVKKMTTKSRLK